MRQFRQSRKRHIRKIGKISKNVWGIIAESSAYASIFPTAYYVLANASSRIMEFFSVVATVYIKIVATVGSYKKWFLWLFLQFFSFVLLFIFLVVF